MPQVAVASRSIDYQRRGRGAPLLLIQGMAGHHALWGETLLGLLVDHFEVVTYDHRGVGLSTDVKDEEFTIADLADDARSVLDAVGWTDAHVLGISMGGMVAQQLVLAHPDRVRALMLGCTYCGGPGSTLQAPGPLRMLQAMSAGNVDVALRTAFTANLSRASPPTRPISRRSDRPACPFGSLCPSSSGRPGQRSHTTPAIVCPASRVGAAGHDGNAHPRTLPGVNTLARRGGRWRSPASARGLSRLRSTAD